MKLQQGQFVNVVGSLDLATGQGRILYVNPSTQSIDSEASGHPDVELVTYDGNGAELQRIHPVVRPASHASADSAPALIQQDLPRQPGMKSVALFYKGTECSRFNAGQPGLPPPANFGLAPADATQPNRQRVTAGGAIASGPGISYKVEVRPEGASAWSTIAIGSPTPEVSVDRNQFPGAKRAQLRITRSTGFDDEVMTDREIDLTAK